MKVIEGIEVLTSLEELVDPKQTALMCIDMQNDNASERGQLGSRVAPVRGNHSKHPETLGCWAGGLEYWSRTRSSSIATATASVCWTDLSYGPHRDQSSIRLMQEDSWEAQTIDELAPRAGDLVILKSRGSAFCGTPLDSNLGARRIRSVIITGIATSGCIFATWIDARTHGYYPSAGDGCGRRSRRGPARYRVGVDGRGAHHRRRPRRLFACGPARRNAAEREGFEPPRPHHLAVFKTAALNHSATSPAKL